MEDVPLVVPEINGECTKGSKLIANPNCTTAIGLMALWPLHKLFKLKKVLMSVSTQFHHFERKVPFVDLFYLLTNDPLSSCWYNRLTKLHLEQDNQVWMNSRKEPEQY